MMRKVPEIILCIPSIGIIECGWKMWRIFVSSVYVNNKEEIQFLGRPVFCSRLKLFSVYMDSFP